MSYLGGHPLALATAASFLALHPSVSAEQYLASYDLQKEESRAKVFVDEHERSLYATLKITLDALAKTIQRLVRSFSFYPSCTTMLSRFRILYPF